MIQDARKPTATSVDIRGATPAFALGVRSFRSAGFLGNAEPSLDEMMSDEVIRRVMARDGVAADQLLTMLENVASRLR